VVRGEPGVGKSALLDYLARGASDCRVMRAAGVESEMELAFAGLHQMLSPVLDRLEQLPVPQREALRTAFGLSAGPGTRMVAWRFAVSGWQVSLDAGGGQIDGSAGRSRGELRVPEPAGEWLDCQYRDG
jgi:hypothetical protein